MAPINNSRTTNQALAGIVNRLQPGIAFIVMIFGALIAFEIFNYSTTDHALGDLLGNLTFAGIPWSTILALAFCGIDFAGIARLFTPEQGMDEPKEVWYLFGAWLLAATMNAILTWWGVSMAVANHTVESSTVIDQQTIMNVVPVFVAVLVWVIRILIIGTLSLAMDRLMHPGVEQRIPLQNAFSSPAVATHRPVSTRTPAPQPVSIPNGLSSASLNPTIQPRSSMGRAAAAQQRASARPVEQPVEADFDGVQSIRTARPEPTYHTLSMAARPAGAEGKPAEPSGGASRFRRS